MHSVALDKVYQMMCLDQRFEMGQNPSKFAKPNKSIVRVCVCVWMQCTNDSPLLKTVSVFPNPLRYWKIWL